jgi:hypothetical protein
MNLLLIEDDKDTVEAIRLCLKIYRPNWILTSTDDG